MTGGGDTDEFEDIPATDFDDMTNQDQEDAVLSDPIPSAGAADIGGRAADERG